MRIGEARDTFRPQKDHTQTVGGIVMQWSAHCVRNRYAWHRAFLVIGLVVGFLLGAWFL